MFKLSSINLSTERPDSYFHFTLALVSEVSESNSTVAKMAKFPIAVILSPIAFLLDIAYAVARPFRKVEPLVIRELTFKEKLGSAVHNSVSGMRETAETIKSKIFTAANITKDFATKNQSTLIKITVIAAASIGAFYLSKYFRGGVGNEQPQVQREQELPTTVINSTNSSDSFLIPLGISISSFLCICNNNIFGRLRCPSPKGGLRAKRAYTSPAEGSRPKRVHISSKKGSRPDVPQFAGDIENPEISNPSPVGVRLSPVGSLSLPKSEIWVGTVFIWPDPEPLSLL